MEYLLKNGKTVLLRPPVEADAEAVIEILRRADGETRFLARNPGEFQITPEKERQMIARLNADPDSSWFLPEYEGKVVGQCSVSLVRSRERYRHRASVAFVLLRDYWGLGIGGKMMEECLRWCRERGVTQVELDVVRENERAQRMYQGFGFKVVGVMPRALRYPDGTDADELIMVKMLKE